MARERLVGLPSLLPVSTWWDTCPVWGNWERSIFLLVVDVDHDSEWAVSYLRYHTASTAGFWYLRVCNRPKASVARRRQPLDRISGPRRHRVVSSRRGTRLPDTPPIA